MACNYHNMTVEVLNRSACRNAC